MRKKILLSYNINPDTQEAYLRFMINDFMPALQNLGLVNMGVWHTAYGDYPDRLLVFVGEGEELISRALATDVWHEMEKRLKEYVRDYARRVVPYENKFQF